MKKRNHTAFGGLAIAIVLVTSVSTRSARAAEEPKPDQPVQEPTAKVPEVPVAEVGADRELVFEDGDPKTKFVMYFDPNRDLPRQRFAAQVLLKLYYPQLGSRMPSDVTGLNAQVPSFEPPEVHYLLRRVRDPSGFSQTAWFRERVERMPDNLKPATDLIVELTSSRDGMSTSMTVTDRSSGTSSASTERPRAFMTLRVTVISEDKERLKALVRAVILVIDEGFSASCHKSYVAMEQRLREWNEKTTRELREGDASGAAMQKELGELSSYDDLTTEALGTLIAHKRIIGVDLAGIEARLEACAKILAAIDSDSKISARREQVETVKITAEIELSGLTAKRKALDDIITAGQRRFELVQELGSFKRDLLELQGTQRAVSSALDDYCKAIAGNCAYARVDTVQVSPIRWLPATKDHPAGAVSAGHFEQEK